jgi:alginate O-acetyltransferase complex protein AlgI
MLFNSYEFVLAFVPVTLLGYYVLGGMRHRLAIAWLLFASLFFYAWWNPIYLLLLLASIGGNYTIAAVVFRLREARDRRADHALALGVAANIALLGYFKYANFFVDSVNAAIGTSFFLAHIVLPLAISFYTFQQISFLVDTARGDIRLPGFLNYATCVAFFPHLIAGPIVLYREILPQFAAPLLARFNADTFAAGVMFFVIGLFKKVVIADTLSTFAVPVFAAAADGATPTLAESWGGALSYTLQLYFDFSGYSDMAIGLALMLNIRLPVNFNSPYKATGIIDFWRRWHITLGRFLRDYLYIGLGGNRRGRRRRYVNLFLTMLLGGIWHGAGWTFVIWGALHGAYLCINHLWRAVWPRAGAGSAMGTFLARTLTLLAVVVGWVVFRAESLDSAWTILVGMAGGNGVLLPEDMRDVLGPAAGWLEAMGFEAGLMPLFFGPREALWIAATGLIALYAPNSQQIMGYVAPNDDAPRLTLRHRQWAPSRSWGVVAATLFVYTLTQMSQISEFLYFQF